MKNFKYTYYLLIYNTMNIVNWFRSYEIISKNLYEVSAVYIILESRFIVFIDFFKGSNDSPPPLSSISLSKIMECLCSFLELSSLIIPSLA